MTPDEINQAIEKLDSLRKSSQLHDVKKLAFELLEQETIQNDEIVLGKVYTTLGIVHKNLSEFSKALEYYNISLKINEEIEKNEGIAVNLGHIGIVYHLLADYTKAIEYYEKALNLYELIGNTFSFTATLNNIAMVYDGLKDYSKAIEYQLKALDLNEKIANKVGIASNLGNIGLISSNQNDFEKALEFLERALEINIEINEKSAIANNLGNIGNVHIKITNFSDALHYLEKALIENQSIGNKNGVVYNTGNIGVVYGKLLDYTKALEFLNKALSLAIEIGAKNSIWIILKEISEIYEQMGDISQAFSYYKQYIDIKEEVYSEDAKNKSQLFDQRRKIEEDEKSRQLKLARFQEQEKILHNILPSKIADRILTQETFIADYFNSVSVLFMDLVGFTALSSIVPPKQLVYLLDAVFQIADEVLEKFELEKIKTIGDGYLAVANVTSPLEEHQKATALAALQILETMRDFTVNIPSDLGDTEWIKDMKDLEIRIGIHTGEVVAGIIGKNKYTYDLWGDAVNVASRMESNSEAGRIHISEQFAKSIESNSEFSIIPRGKINIKGKGTMNTFWLEKGK